MPKLLIFAGLPGVGKTTLSKRLAQKLGAVHLRIDTIEDVLRQLSDEPVDDRGYCLAYRIAADNLRLGMDVIADSCNPIESTRKRWEQVAAESNAAFVNIEIICSDSDAHRQRVETRVADEPALHLPTWTDVRNRNYDLWTADRIIIETAGRSETECLEELLEQIARRDEA